MEFLLHYHISNNGDGSASVHFHSSEDEAKAADEKLEEGWGECCAGEVKIKLENNQVFYRDYQEVGGHYTWVWLPLEKIQ